MQSGGKAFTHESERAMRTQPSRSAADEPATSPEAEAAVRRARAAFAAYVREVTADAGEGAVDPREADL